VLYALLSLYYHRLELGFHEDIICYCFDLQDILFFNRPSLYFTFNTNYTNTQ